MTRAGAAPSGPSGPDRYGTALADGGNVTSPKLFLISVIGAGCFVASGVGGYLALKSSSPASAAPQLIESPEAVTGRQSANSGTAAEPERPARTPASEPVVMAERRGAAREVPAAGSKRTAEPRPIEKTPPEPPPTLSNEVAVARPPETPISVPELVTGPLDVSAPAASLPPPTRELTVPRDAVIGISLETAVSSATAKLEDRVRARVTRDVRVDDITAIPAGARLEGTVTLVNRGGRFKDRSRIGVQFTTLVVDDARIPIETEAIFRDGEAPTREATSKIGASAVVGTILGAVIGGKKGAVVGGTAGAAGGTAAVMASDRNDAEIAEGASLTVRLSEPLAVSIPQP